LQWLPVLFSIKYDRMQTYTTKAEGPPTGDRYCPIREQSGSAWPFGSSLAAYGDYAYVLHILFE
jgi:hypothetical protein